MAGEPLWSFAYAERMPATTATGIVSLNAGLTFAAQPRPVRVTPNRRAESSHSRRAFVTFAC
jgi:hypothetical protein